MSQKCKAEYIEGIIHRDTCHVPLTDETMTAAPAMVSLIAAEAPLAERIREFLSYSGMDVQMDFDQEADLFSLTVPEDQYIKGIRLMKVLLANEALCSMEKAERNRQSDLEPFRVYGKASDRYTGVHSSAFSLLLAVSLLMTALIVTVFDIFRLSFPDRGKSPASLTLTAISVTCLCAGFLSWQKALKIRTKIQEENLFSDSVFQWFLSTYTGTQIDQSADAQMDQDVAMNPEKQYTIISDEIRCLKRMDVIREYIKREYRQLDNGYVEYLCEELYRKVFEQAGQSE